MPVLQSTVSRARIAHPGRRQSGQALVLGLMILAVGIALLLLLTRTGTLLSVRQRLVQAADASAYSAAIWRARVLNSLAYANRTIVAQEVAIAQAVTLAAWARHFETLSGNAEALTAIYPPAAPVLAGLAQSASAGADLTSHAMASEVSWRGAPGGGLTAMLEQAQELLLRSANGFGLSAVAHEVARATDRRFSAFALSDHGSFARFVRRQDSAEERARLREVVLASLDPFTGGSRDRDLRLPLPSSCVGRSTQLDKWTLWYRKRGGTTLAEDLGSWQAVDTASVHDWRGSGFLGLGTCRDREALPLAWGAAGAGVQPDGMVATGAITGSAQTNPIATDLARTGLAGPEPSPVYRGLARIHDLADRSQAYPVSRVAVLVRADRERGLVDSTAVPSFGAAVRSSPAAASGLPSRLWALSAAEIYFRAPPGQGRIEYASLYSPFWQVRLSSPSDAEHAEARGHAR
jgi:hypothetical protein